MTKSIAYAGALAAALLVISTGTAAAQSAGGPSSGDLDSSSLTGLSESGTEAGAEEEGPLGSAGELMPASVTGSLPGYTSGPIGSVANATCAAGTVASAAANLAGFPIPLPVGIVCMVVKPVAESADSLVNGDVEGSVGAVLGGVPLVGGSLEGNVDTASATESVEGSVGERLGSLTETSLTPDN